MITKKELLEMLWGVVNENDESLKAREDAAKNKNKYWRSEEWIYIKDTEVSLKMLMKEIKKSEIILDAGISGLIFDGVGENHFLGNIWAIEKIYDCRNNFSIISNPEK